MILNRSILGATALLMNAAVAAGPAAAQPAGPDARIQVSVSGAFANLFRIEDRSFGKTFSLGAGASIRLTRRLWAEAEVHQVLGLEPEAAPCGLVDIECTGGGRSGYDSATAGSFGFTYRFGSEGVRATLSGGLGFIRAHGYGTVTFGNTGQQVEFTQTDRGWGPTAGVGLRIPAGKAWAIEPGLRIYGADRPNLAVIRAAVGLSREW